MSRPRDTGLVTDADIARAIASLERGQTVLTRLAVATEAGMSDPGLESRHRRRGLTWLEYLAQLQRYAWVSNALDGIQLDEHGAMRGVVVKLEAAEAQALLRLAKSEERPVQLQAARLLREGLRRHGVLPSREPRPLRSAPSDAA